MKKSLLIIAAFVAVSFASCKKDRTCTCTTATSWGTSTDVTVYYKVSKKNAVSRCIGFQTTTTNVGGNNSGTNIGDKTTCELK